MLELIKTENAIGAVLAHDMTQIIRGVTKEARFRKGHIVAREDISVLLSMGKENIYVYTPEIGLVHENDAASILCSVAKGENLSSGETKEGKIELFAQADGILVYDKNVLNLINSVDEISIAAIGAYLPVKKGDKVAGMRVIPLLAKSENLDKVLQICAANKLFSVQKYLVQSCAVVATGSEIQKGLIEDTFSPVIAEKMAQYGCKCCGIKKPGDDKEEIAAAIKEFVLQGAQMIVCTGGMSVDPDDRTPAAIKAAGADIITYGAPVLPGAMFLVGTINNIPILGLPGCVMYAKRTILDLVLGRIMIKMMPSKQEIVALGAGGLCLQCEECHFPNCGFGRSY